MRMAGIVHHAPAASHLRRGGATMAAGKSHAEHAMAEKEFSLTREFVSEVVGMRGFAAQLAELAVEMARQAGETVARPLSQAQIERAMQANGAETRLVMSALIGHLEALYREGSLPEDAGVPRW
jgi:predicted GNAT family acetyltransferase